MKLNRKLLMAKARGFTISIEKMKEAERKQNPNGEYGRDYNRLLAAAKELYPEIASLFPPEVLVHASQTGPGFTSEYFHTVDSYCEQIYQLLSECDDR